MYAACKSATRAACHCHEYRFRHDQRNLTPIPELYVSYDAAAEAEDGAGNLPSLDLTPRQICDLELLMNGGFNPLKGFLTEADYDGVVDNMRLADGALWPMPINLDVSEKFAEGLELGRTSRCATRKA